MTNPKVLSEVTVYEVDGRETEKILDKTRIGVRNHWNRKEMVVIEVDGRRYTVVAEHLKRAIHNATNVGR